MTWVDMERTRETMFTREELMATSAAREIADRDAVFVGTGLPMVASYLAKRTHAPNAYLIFESGILDSQPLDLAPGVGDFRLMHGATRMVGLAYSMSLLQRGVVDIGFLGAAEVDPYGNLNSTVIGDYFHPKVRLPGSGGAHDIASLAQRTIIIIKHQRRKFVAKLSYLTSPGFLAGNNAREQQQLIRGGPHHVISDLAVLGFDPQTKRMMICSLHPGVTLEEVLDNTGFDLIVPDSIPITEAPDPITVQILHDIDPKGMYL